MLLAASYGTVSDIEILWVIIALIGLLFSVVNGVDAFRDKTALTEKGISNGRAKIAKVQEFQEWGRAVFQMIAGSIGLVAMLLPAPPNVHLPLKQAIAEQLVQWGLIACSAIVTLQSYMSNHVRKELLRSDKERDG